MRVVEPSPAGHTPRGLVTGDLLFVHRRGPVRFIIFLGQWLRPSLRPWARYTHVACVIDGNTETLVEAEWPRVRYSPLSRYHQADYVAVRTGLTGSDTLQARRFLRRCVGERYGLLICVGIGFRFLTPGNWGLWLGRNMTGICSGLGAQMLERGWYVFEQLAAAMSPAELARDLGAPPYAT